MMKNEDNFYTTSLGVRVEILAVSPWEMEDIKNSVPVPPVPTRVLETAIPGHTEHEELTEEVVMTDEERAAWQTYVAARDAATKLRTEKATNFMLLEGTRVEGYEQALEAWVAKRRRWNLPVPDDELERRIAFFRTGVLGGKDDLEEIVGRIMRRQGVDEATLNSVRTTFRRAVRGDAAGAAEQPEG